MKFYCNRNNGVVAVIREDHAQLYGKLEAEGKDPFKEGIKVFAFASASRQDDLDNGIFAGDHKDLERLIETGGHTLVNYDRQPYDSRWAGFVPFSNQEHRVYHHDRSRWERFLTTSTERIITFGQ
jgi:hypothetical protein